MTFPAENGASSPAERRAGKEARDEHSNPHTKGEDGLFIQPCADTPAPAALADFGTAWIVTGMTGEYSDRTEWPVAVFWTEEEANAYVDFLVVKRQTLPPLKDFATDQAVEAAMREFDPEFSEDYTGTRWYACPVPLAPRPADPSR